MPRTQSNEARKIATDPLFEMATSSPQTNYLNGAALLLAMIVIGVALKMTWYLVYNEGLPATIRQQIQSIGVTAKVATWNDLGDLKSNMQKIADVNVKISKLKAFVEEPLGPEPDWLWHPFDHGMWSKAKKEHGKLNDLLTEKQALVHSTGDLATDPEKVLQVIESVGPLRVFWNEWVHPYLEVLLIFALLRFGFSLILRMLLINGLIQPTRL